MRNLIEKFGIEFKLKILTKNGNNAAYSTLNHILGIKRRMARSLYE